MGSQSYLDAVRERVVVYDGAFGTGIQQRNLGPDDFGGADLEGCNEMVCVVRPDIIGDLHDSFLAVGVDAIETCTFGAFPVPLAEYGIADRTYEINLAAARIAKEAASGWSTPDRPRWVAGSIGPGTKFASLRQIRFAELRDAYQEQARGLIDGGVDLLLVETQFDLLGLKAAMIGCRRALAAAGRDMPIQAQVTIELTGRMLPGTEIGAALAAADAMRPAVFGINCATGPAEMSEHLRHLYQHSRVPIACVPNAGMPSVVDGHMHYDLSPAELAAYHSRFITEFGVTVVGGCCGTTPEHLAAVVDACRELTPAPRTPEYEAGATSIYSFTPFDQDITYLTIGERTNANGSRKFRDAMLAGDLDQCVLMAREQEREGAHVLDVCVDYVGRDGAADMDEIAARFATQATVPLVLDSTEPPVMEAGLQWIGGRAILNSANLEDGEAPGSRFDRVCSLAREYGAAVICLLIDERGQARDVEWKLEVAHRIHDLATSRYGLEASDLIFDALTFPLSTGGDDLRGDAMATIEAIRRIKAEIPGAHTVLGVSNVSFGLSPAARHVLNSVFLHECRDAGLDAAIVHAARIMPLNRIPDEQRDVCLDLIHDRRDAARGYDPLQELLRIFSGVEATTAVKEDRSGWPVDERLSHRIIDGDRDGLAADLDEAMSGGLAALDIINNVLLAGMKVVGDLFGSGQMQLPFVLQSAETMKAAVAHLEPHMEKAGGAGKGRIVLATVKGDVHDIGKNLVDIILTNNGYEVHNLGIKVSIAEMVEKALEVDADAIGMSGLLVKSTLIMRDNLEELNGRDLARIPVLLGGAALTRSYVERDLRDVYAGRLFYGKDAFEGLHVMDRLGAIQRGTEADDPDWGRVPSESRVPSRAALGLAERAAAGAVEVPLRSPEVPDDVPIFVPPFVGTRVVKGIPIDDIAAYVNETALFRNQWQFRPEAGESDDEFKARIRPVFREELAKAKAADILVPGAVYGFFAANADGDEIVIWEDEQRTAERTRFRFPRQRQHPFLCIADFVRPVGAEVDYVGFHIVTMGPAVSEAAAKLFADDRYQEYLLLHGVGVEMAEALAEYWHRRVREEWGFASEDGPTLSGLFRQQYRGGRYSWGYPACPDLEDNARVLALLEGERLGLVCDEESGFQYQPEQTTSAIILPHPQAKYFVARAKGLADDVTSAAAGITEHRRAMTVGLLLAVTTFAFDALSVTAAMPAVVADLGGVRLYGAAFSAFMLANLFGLALAGGVSDERGPQPVLAAGLACFALGLIVAGTATSMTTVVVGRAIQGLGAGSIGAAAYVVIGRAFAPDERPRMFAILSAAWVVPALVAPAAAGAIAEHLSWRWVFLGLLPFPVVAAVLALPPLAALKPVAPAVAGHAALRARAGAAVQLVAATILFLVGLGSSQLVIGLPVAVLGVALGVAPLRRLLPAGSLRAAGVLPAVIAVRALLNWAFFGTDSFVPLAVTSVRGYTTTFAGLVLTSATLAWSGAAWLQARRAAIWGDRRAVRASLVLVGAGIALVALSLDVDVPIAVVFVGWSLGGAGMGIGFNVTSVIALGEAPAGEEGAISSSLQLADALGIALSTGIGGSIVAAGARNDWSDAPTLLAVFAVSGVAVIPAFFAAGRLRSRPAADVASVGTG